MGFGISNVIKNLSLLRILLQIKRFKSSYRLRKFNCIISIGCNIKNTKFGNSVFLGENVSIVDSSINDYSYINSNSKIKNTSIGKFCSIGPNVQIILGKHPSTFVSSHPIFYANNKPFETFSDKTYIEEYDYVTIGHDVWIAEGVLIPGGVTIGNGAIITARSVVTKDVEPYSIVGGIPAKHIKYRFDEKTVNLIDSSEWWDWEIKKLKANFKLFHNSSEFINSVSKEFCKEKIIMYVKKNN
ncbi:MAG: CatB-related O-acetyltransferase [Bacteroidota bacterium]